MVWYLSTACVNLEYHGPGIERTGDFTAVSTSRDRKSTRATAPRTCGDIRDGMILDFAEM